MIITLSSLARATDCPPIDVAYVFRLKIRTRDMSRIIRFERFLGLTDRFALGYKSTVPHQEGLGQEQTF